MKVEELAEDVRKLSDRIDINLHNLTKRIQYLEKLLEKYHDLESKARDDV